MALTYISVKINHILENKKWVERRFLVDSGATYSVIPTEVLNGLGVEPIDKLKFILGNGEVIEKEIGEVKFSYKEKKRVAPVIFGDKDIFLIGATTLENLGMILDPINRELKPLPMLMV